MNYTLTGSISRTQPYQLDPTLTIEGAGSEAKATGEAIEKVKSEVSDHANSTSNPHKVTKTQLGLGSVDNTPDMNKPVSTAQATAIADAKKAGTDAQVTADNAQTTANNAQTSADNAQTTANEAKAAAENAQTTADEAKAAAENAQTTANSGTAWFTKTVTLKSDGWQYLRQAVDVEGVTKNEDQPIFITPDEESENDYFLFGIKPYMQLDNKLEFTYTNHPTRDIKVKIVGFTVPT